MHRYPIKTAAQLAQASYSATSHPSVAPEILRSLNKGDVEAQTRQCFRKQCFTTTGGANQQDVTF